MGHFRTRPTKNDPGESPEAACVGLDQAWRLVGRLLHALHVGRDIGDRLGRGLHASVSEGVTLPR